MLCIARNLRELSFRKLMDVYVEANRENGARLAPQETENRQLQIGEDDFYSYLHDAFFKREGASYAVWVADERYVSALRLEPYRDGLLLEALETAPDCRRRGYAQSLIRAVQAWLAQRGSVRLYSHVGKRNEASMRVHLKCGFRVIQDSASYIDGSVSNRACTLLYEPLFYI